MAGKKLGSVFVELGLDSTEFTKGEAKILQSAQSTSLKMEQNWRTLGGHSDLIFNAMKTNITNAYDAIANKSTTSAAERLRAEEAMHAKLQTLNEQQFGKQTSLIDGLKAHWIAATVAIGAATVAMAKGWEYYELGAKVMQTEESFRLVTKSSGIMADKLIADMKRASAGTVDDSDIMQKAVKGITLGLKSTEMIGIMEAARVSARVAGEDVKTAYENITDAIATGLPKALKRYGLISKEEMAIVNAALKAGVEDVSLYSIAMNNAAIQAAKFGQLNLTAAEGVQIHKARIQDFKESIGTGFVTAVGTALFWLDKYISVQRKAQIAHRASMGMPVGPEAAPAIIAPTGSSDELEQRLSWALEIKTATLESIKARTKAKKDAVDAEKALLQAQKQMKAEALKDLIASIEAETAEYEKGLIAQAGLMDEASKTRKKMEEEDRKGLIAGIEAETAEYEASLIAAGKMVDEKKKLGADRLKAERDIYKDLRGYETEAHAGSIALIESQAKAYREAKISEVVIAAWVAEETRKADIKKLESSDSFMDGVSAGLLKLKAEQETWGKTGTAVMKTMSSSMASTFSNVFEDAYKGDLKSMKDYSTAIFDAIRKSFFDSVGRMAAEKAITLLFETKWTETGANVLGIINKVIGIADNIWGGETSGGGGGGVAGGITIDSSGFDGGPSVMAASGGRIDFTGGGKVTGIAPYSGDHPGNDKIPGWLSADEVVIRRGAVNPDTAAILDYINRYGQPPSYAFGGRVMNQVTDTPGRGYFGFGDIVSIATGGLSDVVGLTDSEFPTLGRYIKEGDFGSIEELIARVADPTGIVRGGTRMLGSVMPEWMVNLAQIVAPIIGAIWGPGGAAAGSDIASEMAVGYTGQPANEREHMQRAGIAAVLTYVAQGNAGGGWSSGTAEAGYTGATLSSTAISAAKSYAAKWAINQVLKAALGYPENGQMSVNYAGVEDNGVLASIAAGMRGIAPKTYAMPSYERGTDYVPRTGPAMIHQGEKITPAGQVGGFNGVIKIYLDGQEIPGRVKIIADGVVVERNRRGVNSTSRVYQ